MASYPTSVKTFANKSAGDTIQAVDVNDLQDEVHAIEDGLLNGVAGLNSSNSTVANLSVTGNSTVAGSLTVSSNVTVSGSLIVTVPHCALEQRSTQSISDNTWTALNWDTETLDPSGMHSTSANSSRIGFAASSGVYWLSADANFAAVSSGISAVRFILNDLTVISHLGAAVASGSFGVTVHSETLYRMTSTADYVCVQVFQNSGAALQTPTSTSAPPTQCNTVRAMKVSN